MIRLVNLLRRMGLMRSGPPTPAAISRDERGTERIIRLVVERLSEDETLRGDLTDAGFAPILNLVTSLVPAAADRALVGSSPDQAEEAVSRTSRMLTRALVWCAQSGDVTELQERLVPPIVSPGDAERAHLAVAKAQLGGMTPEDRARTIVGVLTSALGEQSA